MATEAERKMAWLQGVSVEELLRRGNVALRAQPNITAGGFVTCEVRGGDRIARMDGSDRDDTVLMNTTPSELGRHARKYLDEFIASGDSADLARSASLISAALARAARR